MREQIERMFPGCDICREAPLEKIGFNKDEVYITNSSEIPMNEGVLFCPRCSRPLTDEAVDMMLKKWRELTNEPE